MGKRFLHRHKRLRCYIVILLLLLPGISLYGCVAGNNSTSTPSNPIKEESAELNSEDGLLKLELIGYMNAIDSFDELTVSEVSTKISAKEDFLLFIGRPTCEWCRKLAPSLQEVSLDKGLEIFYLDSTNTETDSELSNFRTQYDISTVPAVIHFIENGTFTKLDIDLESSDMIGELNDLISSCE